MDTPEQGQDNQVPALLVTSAEQALAVLTSLDPGRRRRCDHLLCSEPGVAGRIVRPGDRPWTCVLCPQCRSQVWGQFIPLDPEYCTQAIAALSEAYSAGTIEVPVVADGDHQNGHIPRPDAQIFHTWLTQRFASGKSLTVDDPQQAASLVGHLLLLAHSVVRSFVANPDYPELAAAFDTIRRVYRNATVKPKTLASRWVTVLNRSLRRWQTDAALYAGEWDAAWELRDLGLMYPQNRRLSVEDFTHVRRRCRDTSLSARDLRLLLLSKEIGLTAVGKEREAEVDAAADRILADRHRAAGVNLVEALLSRFGGRPLSKEDFDLIADECDYAVSPAALNRLYQADPGREAADRLISQDPRAFGWLRLRPLFEDVPERLAPDETGFARRLRVPGVPVDPVPTFLSDAIRGLCRSVFRDAENDVRRAEGLPEIGAGWVGEAELHELVVRAFPDTIVVRHARPDWLRPQHLDTYLPQHNIGIEFQGAQHVQPIDYFGGEKAYRAQLKRDARKRRLCAAHDCSLILVYEGYDPFDLLDRIRSTIATGDSTP